MSRATGPKWIAAAIAIAANQASVISQPGNQPTMTSPNAPRGSNAGAHPSALHVDYYGTIGIGGNNKTAFGEGLLLKVAIGRGALFAQQRPGGLPSAVAGAELAADSGFGEPAPKPKPSRLGKFQTQLRVNCRLFHIHSGVFA